jgi:hypothetical protein
MDFEKATDEVIAVSKWLFDLGMALRQRGNMTTTSDTNRKGTGMTKFPEEEVKDAAKRANFGWEEGPADYSYWRIYLEAMYVEGAKHIFSLARQATNSNIVKSVRSMASLASLVAKREGKKSQARIGDIREILKILAEIDAEIIASGQPGPRVSDSIAAAAAKKAEQLARKMKSKTK